MARRERPLLTEERDMIQQLHKSGWKAGAIAKALFIGKRQVKFVITHPDNGEAVKA